MDFTDTKIKPCDYLPVCLAPYGDASAMTISCWFIYSRAGFGVTGLLLSKWERGLYWLINYQAIKRKVDQKEILKGLNRKNLATTL